SQILIEGFDRGEETPCALVPREGLGAAPFTAAPRHLERPIHEVAGVGKDLAGSSRPWAYAKFRKSVGRSANRLRRAVSQRGHRVAQHLALRIAGRRHQLSILPWRR